MRVEYSPYGYNIRGVRYTVYLRDDEEIRWLYYMTSDGMRVIYGYEIRKRDNGTGDTKKGSRGGTEAGNTGCGYVKPNGDS